MEIRPHRKINRKKTKEIKVGKISVGGNSQISVQSMTNTLTTDITATINQIHLLEEAGADLVRVSCPDEDSTKALKKITKEEIPIAKKLNVSMSNLAIAWCLLNKNVSTVILGASKLGQLEENLRSMEVLPLLDESIQEELKSV